MTLKEPFRQKGVIMTVCYGYIRTSPKINDISSRIQAFSTFKSDIELFKET